MSQELSNNPFAALFNSIKDAECYKQQHGFHSNDNSITERQDDLQCSIRDLGSTEAKLHKETKLLEQLLLVTVDANHSKFPCVHLAEFECLNLETLDMILFERLLLAEPESNIVSKRKIPKLKEEMPYIVGRADIILYLYDVYERCLSCNETSDHSSKVIENVKVSVVTNLFTALEQPEIYNGQNPSKQLENLIIENLSPSKTLANFLRKLLQESDLDKVSLLLAIFKKVINTLRERLSECSLMGVDWDMIDIMDFYSSSELLGKMLLENPDAANPAFPGRRFQHSALGSLLAISCLPRLPGKPFDFFEKPSSQSGMIHEATAGSIGVAQNAIQRRVHQIFLQLLKSSASVKDDLMKWLELCLSENSGRAGLWNIQAGEFQALSYVSDGFMVNLGAALLMLSEPFTKDAVLDKDEYKVLKVSPFFCDPNLLKNGQVKGLYSGDLPKQTFMIPHSNKRLSVKLPTEFSFVTACFYLTQRALHLGTQVIHQKLFKLYQELSRLHQQNRDSGPSSPNSEVLRHHMETRTQQLLSFKAAVFQSDFVIELMQFQAATALWLTQISLFPNEDPSKQLSYRKIEVHHLSSKEEDDISHINLESVPEFIIESLVESILATKRFNEESLVLCGGAVWDRFMTLIAVFMGSPQYVYNPHLRAHLAECLEAIIPGDKSSAIFQDLSKNLFTNHSLVEHLSVAITHVFVSIEVSGQAVAFEEKFNYRRPMYEVIKHLWEIRVHKLQFSLMADYALINMESARPPLFLRFVNLLINDGIFLLDEGLSYMAQIKEAQIESDSVEFSQLTDEQRADHERTLHQNSLLARFHNMLGSRNIHALSRLTENLPAIFIQPSIVDRVTAMLNHFLQHLVGPKQGNLKVRDMEKFEFRPSEMVSDICTIYTHLGKNSSFRISVSSDGRSYSSQLFKQACSVLNRINHYTLAEELDALSVLIEEDSVQREKEEDLAASAPEEFLDPIMSHLMSDPVLLPSSKVIVDRQTIARHLLSDQVDPFNRQPLTMNEIIPAIELKEKIEKWIEEQRELRRKNSESS